MFPAALHAMIVNVVFLLASSQPSSLSNKLSELASRRADWLSSMTFGRKSCRSLELVSGGRDDTDRDESIEQGGTLQRSASSSCISSPVSESDVSVSPTNCMLILRTTFIFDYD